MLALTIAGGNELRKIIGVVGAGRAGGQTRGGGGHSIAENLVDGRLERLVGARLRRQCGVGRGRGRRLCASGRGGATASTGLGGTHSPHYTTDYGEEEL